MNVRPASTRAAAALAVELNENVERVRVQEVDWSRFIEQGVLVKVTFRRWRAEMLLTLDDLGIAPPIVRQPNETDKAYAARFRAANAALSRIVTPGKLHLLPKIMEKRAKSLEDKAREWRDKCAFKTFWGQWIRQDKYQDWKAKQVEITDTYAALAIEIRDNWDTLMRQVRNDYAFFAVGTYRRLVQSDAWKRGELTWLPDETTYVQEFVARIMAKIPSREFVVASYRTEYEVRMIPLQATVAEDRVEANRIQLDAATQIMMDDVRATAAREASAGIGRFVADVQDQIRSQVYDVAVATLEALDKGDGVLSRNTTRGLKNLVETVSTSVFWEDPYLERRIAELNQVVSQRAEKRNTSELRETLRALGAEARIVLTELDRTPARSGQSVGIPDDLGSLTRIARRDRDAAEDLLDIDMFDVSLEVDERTSRDIDL